MTPAKTSRTFFAIVEDLAVWQETLEYIEERLKQPMEDAARAEMIGDRSEIRTKREELGLELIAKVDGIAAVDRRFDAEIQIANEAEKSAAKHRKALEASKQWLRQYVLSVMDERGMKHLKTPLTTITAQRNGGAAPVEITDLEKLPANLCWLVGRIREDIFVELKEDSMDFLESAASEGMWRFTREPDTAAISKALQEPCSQCLGIAQHSDGSPCAACGGSGTAKVSGARLAPRGRHIRIA